MTHILSKQPKHKRFCLEKICGNCLERLGVHNEGGGFAIIDKNAECKVGDVVHCLKHDGNIRSYLKQVKRIEENNIIVGTAYYDESKDYEFEVGEILGVVIETYGGSFGNYREYVRPTHLCKKKRGVKENEILQTNAANAFLEGLNENKALFEKEILEQFVQKLKTRADELKQVLLDGQWAISQYDIDRVLKETVGENNEPSSM